mgnify:CR=1 FL=1
MANKQNIVPSLWFNDNAEEAIEFYLSIFPNSRIKQSSRYGAGGPFPEGTMMSAIFELDGLEVMALNGGPMFKFNEAISLMVKCETQDEVDKYWKALIADGGQEGPCGWCKDKYGVSWQVVPAILGKLMSGNDAQRAGRVAQALQQMKKLDIKKLQAAYDGN